MCGSFLLFTSTRARVRQQLAIAHPRILGDCCHNQSMAGASLERTRDDVVRLAHRGLGVRDFSMSAARILRRAVPFDGVCVMTMDPATLLPTGHFIENGLPDETAPRLAEIELQEPDFNKFTELARRRPPAASLSESTGGQLERSRRQRELRRPYGFEDELRAALTTDSGTWGGIVLMRESGRPHFAPAETRLLASLTGELAEGLRRALLLNALSGGEAEGGPGLLLLAPGNSVELANPAARAWLDELAGDGGDGEHLPFVIHTVADRARNIAASRVNGNSIASARVRTRSGVWLLVRGSVLGDGPDARAAVMMEAARSPELAPLIAEAYGLTPRERAVTQLVAQGLPTSEIASRLYLSPYTVQDHLKSIFEKTGVGTRGELVARLFLEH
jgi:DNA-binding CsgD family transcriptional regulator